MRFISLEIFSTKGVESEVAVSLLDFITRQDDRHLSNIAIKISGGNESFYALYDRTR